jgi:hypothetical protein
VPFVCLTTLERQPGRYIALAVIRSVRQGHIEAGERELFASLAPHVRAAVRTQVALAGRGVSLLTGALEAVAIPVFVCDSAGKVRRLTPAAEALIRRQRGLDIKDGHLRPLQSGEARALDEAILSVGALRERPSLLLCKGNTAEAIAKTRRVTVGTVAARAEVLAMLEGTRDS